MLDQYRVYLENVLQYLTFPSHWFLLHVQIIIIRTESTNKSKKTR